jgi:protein gp37
MADKTGIAWTDATWNPIRGCSRVSEGCRNCYAETVAARFSDEGAPYHGFAERGRPGSKWTGKVELIPNMLDQPLRWKKPRRIFVNSMSDLFHDALPDEAIDRIFAVMALATWHTFQVLTKRPERMRDYCKTLGRHHESDRVSLAAKQINTKTGFCYTLGTCGWHLPNVWLGVSVEDQGAANERIPILLDTPAAKRFISAEPLLGPMDLAAIDCDGWHECLPLGAAWLGRDGADELEAPQLNWVIVGGESGPNARPMHPDWARDLRDQCQAAGVPFFFKQWGEWTPGVNVERQHGIVESASWFNEHLFFGRENLADTDGHIDDEPDLYRVGKKAAGALLDGRAWEEFPA